MIFKFFVLSFLVFINSGCAADNREPLNILRHRHPTIAYGMPYPEDGPCEITAEVIGEIKTEINEFLERLGKGSFSFKDTVNESEGIKTLRETITSCAAQDPLYAMIQLKRIWSASLNQDILATMINIAKGVGLYEEATDLYMLSGLMLAISSTPRIPNANHLDLFTDSRFYKEGFELKNIDIFAQRPDLLSVCFSLIPKCYFKNALLLMRKTCLLFPESGTNICHLGVMVSQKGLEIDDRGELILPEQRNEIAARFYRQAKTPLSIYNLSTMLLAKKLQHDENNNICKTDSDVYVAVARLLQKSLKPYVEKHTESSMYPLPLHDFAYLIRMGFINTDQRGAPLRKLDKKSRNKKAADLLREILIREKLPNSCTLLAGMIFHNETDLDEDGTTKLTTDQSKLTAIERLCSGVNTGEASFIEALVYSRNGDVANALIKIEQALEKGYTQALSLFYQLKAQVEASSLEARADESEDDDIETDDESAVEVTETNYLHQPTEAFTASSVPDASLLAYRAQQAQ